MNRTILLAIFMMMGMAMQAQGIRVNYKGATPTIADFVTTYLSQEDDEEMIKGIWEDWESRQQGKALSNGASFTVDVKNGFIRYDKRYTANTYSYTEFCFWNCKDGKHKLLGVNRGCIEQGKPVTAQFTGLKFYTYDNQTKRMTQTLNTDSVPAFTSGRR